MEKSLIAPVNVIYSTPSLRLTVSSQASEEGIDLLKRTIYGTSGPKYQHTGQENKVKYLTDPYFFDLWVNEKLAGTYCLSGRLVKTPIGEMNSFYGRYFSVDPVYGGKGYGSLLIKESTTYVERKAQPCQLIYGYIEETNYRSLKASAKEEPTSIGVLETLIFSRLYPKMDSRVSRLAQRELADKLLPLLATTYKNYTLVQFDRVYYEQNYFVLKEGEEIIAGVQANPVEWRIADMPGMSGKIIMYVLPHIPIIQRLFNPKRYRFVALEAMYVKPGREEALLTLLESVLTHFQVTSGLLTLDINCPINRQLQAMGKLGIMNALKKRIHTHVLVISDGMVEKQIKQVSQQPIYVSGFDCS